VGHNHQKRPRVTLRRQRQEHPLLYDLYFIQTHFAAN
jgi:hypothetical protein